MVTNQKAENVRDVIRYLQKFKNALVVIYLDDKTIESLLYSSHIRDIALLHEAGLQVLSRKYSCYHSRCHAAD